MKKILFFFCALIISSCSTENKETPEETAKKEEDRRIEQIDKKFKELLNEVTMKYKILYEWDTLRYQYSYEYRPVINSDYQIIKTFTIEDVLIKDTSFLIKLVVGVNFLPKYFHLNTFYFALSCSKDLLQQITDKQTRKILLVKTDTLDKINMSRFRVGGQIWKIFSIKN
jgi:hypothetical protein